jgi:universal stress protein A
MFKKILLPVDLTDGHARSLDIAAGLAAGGGEVTLLHVIELIAELSDEEGKEFYGRLERAARDHLAKVGGQLDERRVAWRSEVVYGKRAQEILRHARENESDVIVVTSHRVNLQDPTAGWGTLSYTVGIFSQCPVLLVK